MATKTLKQGESFTDTAGRTGIVNFDPKTGARLALGAQTSMLDNTVIDTSVFDAQPLALAPTIPLTANEGMSEFIRSTNENSKTAYTPLAPIADLQEEQNDYKKMFVDSFKTLAGAGKRKEELYKEGGVDKAKVELDEITSQIESEQLATRRAVEKLQQNPQGLYGGALEDEVNRVNRESLSRQADLSILQNATLRRYDTAAAIADRKLEAEIEPVKVQLDALKFFYAENKDQLSKEDQRAYEAKIKSDDRSYNQMIVEKKSLSDTKLDLLKLAAEQGAPLEIQRAIQSAQTPEAAIMAAGTYAGEKKYTYNDGVIFDPATGTIMNPGATTVAGTDPNILAYASQYASTGAIPTGMPKGTFGEVARIAKEMPKPAGTIVSNITGIKDSKVTATVQDDMVRLYNITENVKKLEELDKKRVGGLVSGIVGKVFGSKDQSEYLTIKKAIVDDIQRMQSGAALSESEQDFYEDYLPGRYSETFFLGQDSGNKIKNFAEVMNDKLKNGLANNGLSIYGYSKVKIGDEEFPVGGTIERGGLKGTVLPDGTISVPDDVAETLSTVTIPESSRLSFVNNNPGNLRYAGQRGATQGEGGFARFNSPEEGAAALKRQIELDASRGHTLASFINKFAPPSENNTKEYVEQVARQLGIPATTQIKNVDINSLTKAIARKESGSKLG